MPTPHYKTNIAFIIILGPQWFPTGGSRSLASFSFKFIVYFLIENMLNMIYSNHRFESMAKRIRYSESYPNIGFTTVLANDGIEKPRCVLCHAVLSAESMKPSKLKRHLETKHPELTKKDLYFFKQHDRCLKSQ